ncbi:terminase family protein [bacterium]|nr:terminase family protein [bacterium]
MSGQKSIVWSPQAGPQKALIDCPLPEIFYGGARGGGKTDGVLGKFGIKAETYGKNFNAVFFRKELPMLDDAIERSQQIYGPLGAKWQDQKKQWRFPSGGRLRFRPLERVQDAEKYQGQNISDICVEEAGIYSESKPIDRLNGVLRSAGGVPTQLILTGNPGGAGQHWIKERYIDPVPQGIKVLNRKLPNGSIHKYVFIPSKVHNNRILMQNDPDYINRLYLVGSEQLVKAWLEGDWSAIEGAFFDCWNSNIVIRPIKLPDHWTRFRSFDWGSARPFSVGWWAIASEDYEGIPKNAMVRYREWYGSVGPNKGLKMTAGEVAKGIIERESEVVNYSVADPAIFTADGGPSISEMMANEGVYFRAADNKRVATKGHMGGWDQMRGRMKDNMIFTFSTCADSIRTIPGIQHDINKPEDLDTTSEDHAADEWRYACMSRPYTRELESVNNDHLDAWGRPRRDDDESWKTA